ncbi:MAG: endo-1,4-beta-xylanase [Bryobacterales bacterium]|nr:endo-1,4-beta-xylanase [Bryobacterales bacterium]
MRHPWMALLFVLPLYSQSLSQPVPVLAGDPLRAFAYSGPVAGEKSGRAEIVDVGNMPFTQAWRLSTLSLPKSGFNEWDIRIRARPAIAATKDDMVLATFWLRCIEPQDGECVIRFNVEQSAAPNTKSVSIPYLAGADWKQYKVLFRMAGDYAPTAYIVDFWMGQQIQQAEVGGIQFLNYGPGVRPEQVGVDPLYPGASQDAAWRAPAEERIERIRKADLTVEVIDAAGKPVPSAEVRVRMTRHAFGWGTAIAAEQLLGSGADSDRYRQFILDNFNMVVFENDLKWPQWERNRTRPLDAIRWLNENGITRIRGHNLVWPGWRYMPADVQQLASQPEALRKRVMDRVKDAAAGTRGMLEDWDVINEAHTNRDVQNILGNEEMVAWFKAAKDADPFARLFINDYNILTQNGANLLHRNGYYSIISYLLDSGAPVEGIGMQGHFSSPTDPEIMLRILDRFSHFGLPVEITEYDFVGGTEELQAHFTRDLMTVVFSHPTVSNFLMWGFWEARHWKPEGAMIRRNWTSKPMHDVWREMIYERWWTDVRGATSEQGVFSTRGFKGNYEIEVQAGGKSKKVPASLFEATTVRVTLE